MRVFTSGGEDKKHRKGVKRDDRAPTTPTIAELTTNKRPTTAQNRSRRPAPASALRNRRSTPITAGVGCRLSVTLRRRPPPLAYHALLSRERARERANASERASCFEIAEKSLHDGRKTFSLRSKYRTLVSINHKHSKSKRLKNSNSGKKKKKNGWRGQSGQNRGDDCVKSCSVRA